jgi:hypothetical protein
MKFRDQAEAISSGFWVGIEGSGHQQLVVARVCGRFR